MDAHSGSVQISLQLFSVPSLRSTCVPLLRRERGSSIINGSEHRAHSYTPAQLKTSRWVFSWDTHICLRAVQRNTQRQWVFTPQNTIMEMNKVAVRGGKKYKTSTKNMVINSLRDIISSAWTFNGLQLPYRPLVILEWSFTDALERDGIHILTGICPVILTEPLTLWIPAITQNYCVIYYPLIIYYITSHARLPIKPAPQRCKSTKIR